MSIKENIQLSFELSSRIMVLNVLLLIRFG